MSPLIVLLLIVPIIGFPLFFNWLARRVETRVEESRNWNAVEGTVVRSKAYQVKGVWRPSLVYSYGAQGQQLRSSRYCFGDFTGPKAEVHALVARHPEGSKVQVYYDPTKPTYAVLERTGQPRNYRVAGWVLSATFTLFFAMVLFALQGR